MDTNLLLRLSDPHSRHHQRAKRAVAALFQSGATLCITPQNVVEFWSVATRPTTHNGLGLPPATAQREVERHRAAFMLLPDTPAIFAQWERLVKAYAVEGILAHDTRLAAVALVYGLPNLLTFNVRDFARFAPEGLNITAPAAI